MTSTLTSCFVILAISLNLFNKSNGQNCYRGAVLEHVFQGILPTDQIKLNLDAYEKAINLSASHQVDILVLPEDGIFNPAMPRDVLSIYAEDIPNIVPNQTLNPCTDHSFDDKPILQRLSCLAMKYEIYLVADMADKKPCNATTKGCPIDLMFLYNTQIAFDKSGNLTARYHKRNLAAELYYNVPDVEIVTFDTKFGRFGLFICFDIVFQSPAIDLINLGVDSIAMSTEWFDESPFGLAHQIQQGWAITNQVNLLAANQKRMSSGTTGSGLYSRYEGALNYEHSMSPPSSAKLLIANLPIDPKSGVTCEVNSTTIELDYGQDNSVYNQIFKTGLTDYAFQKLSISQDSYQQCDNGLCCKLDYRMTSTDSSFLDNYYLIVKNGIISGSRSWWEGICAVAAYDLKTFQWSAHEETVFEMIKLEANFTTDYVYPSVLANEFKLTNMSDWLFAESNLGKSVLVYSKSPVTTAMLYGRNYDKDPPYP